MSKKAPERKIKAVLFDLGKVLLHFNFAPAFKKLSKHCSSSPEDIEAFFIQSGLEVLYDGGKISSKEFYNSVQKALDLQMGFEEFRDVWNHIFTPIAPMVKLVHKLRAAKYRLVLISNTNPMHFEFAVKKYAFLKKFHRRIASYQEKIRKPDERIYRTAIEACRAQAPQIFYIDDRRDLTEAASEIGLRCFTFKNNYRELLQDMKKAGIAL